MVTPGGLRAADIIAVAALATSVVFPLWLNRPQRSLEAVLATARVGGDLDTLVVTYLVSNRGNRTEVVFRTSLFQDGRGSRAARAFFVSAAPIVVRPGEAIVDSLRAPISPALRARPADHASLWLKDVVMLRYVLRFVPVGLGGITDVLSGRDVNGTVMWHLSQHQQYDSESMEAQQGRRPVRLVP